jgi:hypothetical protein
MTSSVSDDLITVLGSAYFQPIADLIEKLLNRDSPSATPGGAGHYESGYSAALIVLLASVLESFTARVRFLRRSEGISGAHSTPDLLALYFPGLVTEAELIEVFLVRNAVAHNHIWHLNVSDSVYVTAPSLASPKELGFQTNKRYSDVVDVDNRRTVRLRLNVNPTAVDRSDVQKVFRVVFQTLKFMNAKSFSDTPLAGGTVAFRGKYRRFEDLLFEFDEPHRG